jgi:hypothetical protein
VAGEWTIETLKEHFDSLRKDDQIAVAAALSSAERAVAKADLAVEKRFDGVNEFRQALADQSNSLLPRQEYNAQHGALVERIEQLVLLVNKMEARTDGRSGIATPLLVTLAGFGASALVTFALLISGHLH